MGFTLKNTQPESIGIPNNSSKKQKPSIFEREIRLFKKSFSSKRKEDFYTELSVLLKAGVTLKDSLKLMAEEQKDGYLNQMFRNMGELLVSGHSFSDAIKNRSDFSEYEYYSLKIGEESGKLQIITQELAAYFANKNEQRRNLVNALTYPIIILVTAIVVVVFMLRLVVPMFQDIFAQNEVDLPWITLLIIAISDFLSDYGGWLLLLFLVMVLSKKILFKGKKLRRHVDYALLKLPYLGSFLRAVYLAQFTRAISLLIASGVPVLSSIQMSGRMIAFFPLIDSLEVVSEKIMLGKSLSDSLQGNKVFDNKMISMVRVAEETNQTEFIFDRLSQQYSIEVQQKSKLLNTLLEPLIILTVGVCVGVILVAMYLPMFKLGSVLQ
ncbi:type II secretion system F family protein [Flagellimonas sp.]|uniref:type II secretion system F family protein n=1 Tax=Flagellimonas sp. TaxID=2058762 RepID=UPI003F4A7C87